MDLTSTFASLGIALGLGLLVGLQREQAASRLAGMRTFALITMLGTICGLLATSFGGWAIAAGFFALTGAVIAGHMGELNGEKAEAGITTEVAALAMFGVGAYLVTGHREAAIAMGGGIAVLLQFKGQLHGIASRLGEDSRAIMQFVLIAMVILPILPNQTYGPFNVINPRQIWLMVVLIVGIGLGGYIIYKFFGEKAGLLFAGVVGGIISSTATTVSYSKQTTRREAGEAPAATVILLASTASCALVLLEVGVVAPTFLPVAMAPLSAMTIMLGALSLASWFSHGKESSGMPAQRNPSELQGALWFALLYTLILLTIAFVRESFGARGLYAVAVASGFAEVHALALSTAQLVETGRLAGAEGWRIIAVALVSNIAFKAAAIAALGTRGLSRRVALPYALTMGAGVGMVLLWR